MARSHHRARPATPAIEHPSSPSCIGRDVVLAALDEWLAPHAGMVWWLYGIGGIGKTPVARTRAALAAAAGRRVAWVDGQVVEPSPRGACEALSEGLGIDGAEREQIVAALTALPLGVLIVFMDKLQALLGRAVVDFSATMQAGRVVLGDRFGLYRALAEGGAMRPDDGAQPRLEAGASVADIGCGHGTATILMAQAFPNSRFVGYDSHEGSVQIARERGARAGVADRVRFEVANAADHPGRDFDLITVFDALHDLGDPIGASAHVLGTLKADGIRMIVEPNAADQVEDNLNPFGRAFYAGSTLMCVPCATKQGKVAQSPTNLVLEARP